MIGGHGRTIIGDIVFKYILLYMSNKEIFCIGKMQDEMIPAL